jgi:hypothetical protein
MTHCAQCHADGSAGDGEKDANGIHVVTPQKSFRTGRNAGSCERSKSLKGRRRLGIYSFTEVEGASNTDAAASTGVGRWVLFGRPRKSNSQHQGLSVILSEIQFKGGDHAEEVLSAVRTGKTARVWLQGKGRTP